MKTSNLAKAFTLLGFFILITGFVLFKSGLFEETIQPFSKKTLQKEDSSAISRKDTFPFPFGNTDTFPLPKPDVVLTKEQIIIMQSSKSLIMVDQHGKRFNEIEYKKPLPMFDIKVTPTK